MSRKTVPKQSVQYHDRDQPERRIRYLVIEHRRSEIEKKLIEELKRLRSEQAQLRRQYLQLEQRFGDEIRINAELIDLLKANGIRYRQIWDHRERKGNR